MKLSLNGRYRQAIHCVFVVGAFGASVGPAVSHAQDATQLQGVEVTGSRIRRVDTETASAVQVLNRDQILATGASTLGELLQSIPSFGGTPYNSAVNNGGGSGEAYVDLRGLGAKRTLILLDGQRLNNGDVNAIPSNMIERVEVLKEGAAAVYGTDAIGGVVNFITRKNFTGIEAEASVGQTQKHDGSNGDIQITFGTKAGPGNVVFGALFNRQDAIKASARSFSDAATGLYYGQIDPNAYSSSRGPGGRFLGVTAGANSLDSQCPGGVFSGVTLIDGRDGSSSGDFRNFCNNSAPGYSDRYNYQPDNLVLTPSKRFSLFGTAQEPIVDGIRWFGSGSFTNTRAHSQLAPEPFDYQTIQGTYPGSTPTLSGSSIYNPFGTDITTFFKRATLVGDRVESYDTNSYQATTGFKGTLIDRFQWDTTFNYGRYTSSNSNYGFLDFSKIFQEIGPSYYADPTTGAALPQSSPGAVVAGGVPTCGTPGNPIPNCTPVNVFGTDGNNLSALGTTTNFLTAFDETDIGANISGDLFKLPAGQLAGAAGVAYRTLHYANTPDALAQEFALSENNSKATSGAYNVREAYLELSIPVVAGLPAVKSLNLDLGGRYSNYSSFGNNTAGKAALEYRPYSDLLVRATYNDVYRAPTTSELFQGAVQNAPSYSDPCAGLDDATLAAHPTACAGVPAGYVQNVSQSNGNVIGNPDLQPEKGYATDFGLVYDPSFYKPLSVSVDYFLYSLKDAIDTVGIQTILDACFANESSAFCGDTAAGEKYFTRNSGGDVVNSYEPFVNANKYLVKGVDASIKLNYPKVIFRGYDFGRISMGMEFTYNQQYDLKTFDPASGAQTADYSEAGQFDANTGISSPRFRGLGSIFWSKGPYSVAILDRYIGNMKENYVDYVDTYLVGACGTPGFTGSSYDAGLVGGVPGNTIVCNRNTGSANYVDMAGTYSFKQYHTDLTVGITDLFDDGAQAMYNASNAGAANPIYDVRGRSFYAKMVVRFK